MEVNMAKKDKKPVNRKEEKQKLRDAILKKVLAPKKVQKKYNVAICNRDFMLEMDGTLQVAISRHFDNKLRNYAHSKGILTSHRLDAFLKEKSVHKVLNKSPQRSVAEDIQSIRWNYTQKKLTKLEACILIVSMFPKKASEEIRKYVADSIE